MCLTSKHQASGIDTLRISFFDFTAKDNFFINFLQYSLTTEQRQQTKRSHPKITAPCNIPEKNNREIFIRHIRNNPIYALPIMKYFISKYKIKLGKRISSYLTRYPFLKTQVNQYYFPSIAYDKRQSFTNDSQVYDILIPNDFLQIGDET